MKKLYLALALMVFFAGCTTANKSGTTSTKKTSNNTQSASASEDLEVTLGEFPDEIAPYEIKYFKVNFRALRNVGSVAFQIYSIGANLESSCEARLQIRNFTQGETKQNSCSLKISDIPSQDTAQQISYEALYQVSSESGQLLLEVNDGELAGSPESQIVTLSSAVLESEAKKVKEGSIVRMNFEVDGRNLAMGGGCMCSVEKALIRIPSGFLLSGLTTWSKYSCGEFSCYEKRNLQDGYSDEFYITAPSVVRTEVFNIGAEVSGIWKAIRGSDTVSVRSEES
jgi:hypothetical protein